MAVGVLSTSALLGACAPTPARLEENGAKGFAADDAARAAEATLPTHDLASERWGAIKTRIRTDFPEVETISADALARELEENPQLVLLDARAPEEFAVSHLEGARRALTKKEALTELRGLPPEQTVVVYCSVGYRSARLAEKLAGEGFTNVRNLEGSIFEWANAGRPVFRGASAVHEVHPYDGSWGELLRPDLWSREQSSHAPR
jgi:rhodanese-related sulfurtransferase